MKSALITAGNGAIKQVTFDLLAICLCIGEIKKISVVMYLIVYNKYPKFYFKIAYFC